MSGCVTVTGPLGDFWLRPADAPLLLIAGGSGLAPILALLEDALANGVARPVTLLFGARGQRDLYALAQIRALETDQIQALTTDQVGVMTSTQVAAMTTDQVAALETEDLAAMGTMQIKAFTSAKA